MTGALLSGVVAGAGFGTELRTIDTISLVERQLSTEVESLAVADGELRVTITLTNPTGYPIEL
ncbi:MAG: hypothetical protein GWN07_16210, partial [Actinobacteria bacterium]|nr:hypothetical protein [Actinomycetota bacterium]NIW28826.1 hypothetical protein [Actinomycetota bacterium]NIX21289.1 hypothetical protein [Actinomycetota bacterium]